MSTPLQTEPPKSPPKQRIDLLRRFAKPNSASQDVTDLGLIKRVYPRAIAFGGAGGEMLRGISQAAAFGGGVMCLWFSSVYFRGLAVAPGITHAAVLIFAIAGALFFLWTYTLTFFLPEDDSVIFDRGSRQVHWVSMQLAGKTRLAALKRPVIEVRSADWSLIDGEHRAIVKVNTASASRSHDLAFVVRKSASDPTVVDEFGIAPSMMLAETTTPALWEHIRRYMEEDGPPLPPGSTEPSPTEPKPKNWWQSMGLVGPFGPRYFRWWKHYPWITLIAHVLLPISVPVYLAWSFLNWVSYATEQKVVWPQSVLDSLGRPLNAEQIRAGLGGALISCPQP
ncbi:hypothetical protein BH11PSE13_BH11PSE13_13370 [soil metagenome]